MLAAWGHTAGGHTVKCISVPTCTKSARKGERKPFKLTLKSWMDGWKVLDRLWLKAQGSIEDLHTNFTIAVLTYFMCETLKAVAGSGEQLAETKK